MSKPNKANPHTVKKFELVANYVSTWAQTLLNAKPHGELSCRELVFIDCMCNNGIYEDDNGNSVEGTPIRVAKIIADIMPNHPNQKATLYFNDSDPEKIAELKKHLPPDTGNFQTNSTDQDGNDRLKTLWPTLHQRDGVHYLLFYDPYKAAIDWEALSPYFFGWGEFILNHMVSDPLRALKSAKSPEAIDKYEQTYLTPFEKLAESAGDRKDYERRLQNIIEDLCRNLNRKYYVATVPFFIKTNALIYDLVFFTKNIKGFQKFKTAAWKTFGGKSSNQNTHGREAQLYLPFFGTLTGDKQCYFVSDIADYIVDNFKGSETILLKNVWDFIDENHPVFPTGGYIKEIKKYLKQRYGCKIHGRKKDEQTITFIKR